MLIHLQYCILPLEQVDGLLGQCRTLQPVVLRHLILQMRHLIIDD